MANKLFAKFFVVVIYIIAWIFQLRFDTGVVFICQSRQTEGRRNNYLIEYDSSDPVPDLYPLERGKVSEARGGVII